MKPNRIEKGRHHGLLAAGVVALAAAGVGGFFAYDQLLALYREQCVIRDLAAQVSVTSGKMVKGDVIAEHLGLRVGANLATIDFAKKREDLLARVPNLRSVRIVRRLPDKVVIIAEERTPVARIIARGNRTDIGRVVDAEGVVFAWQRGTQGLPVIREAAATARGERIAGRARAALALIEACREANAPELAVLDVDTQKRDFLSATLGDYSKLKILWNGMDEPPTPAARADLQTRLDLLRKAIRTQIQPQTVIWNATIAGLVFADSQEKF